MAFFPENLLASYSKWAIYSHLFLGNQTPIFLDIFHNVDFLAIKTALPFRFLMRIKEALLYVMVRENRVSLKIMHLRKLKKVWVNVSLCVYLDTYYVYTDS